jgi:hypothetical protein
VPDKTGFSRPEEDMPLSPVDDEYGSLSCAGYPEDVAVGYITYFHIK